MNDERTTLMVTLDMSAAFDTIDHTTLVDRLQNTFGVSGQALRWVASYLHDPSTFVKWGSGQSTTAGCKVGVPQGSALDPLPFTLFVGPLANVTQAYGIKHHRYADDTQMYICVKKSDNSSSDIGALKRCTDAVYTWLSNNGLALNPSISEVVKFDCRKQTTNQITAVKVTDPLYNCLQLSRA